jgi:hypothetical protein
MRSLRLEPWIHALLAGATAGVLVEALAMRLNPELPQSAIDLLVSAPAWASWGLVGAGLPLVAALAAVRAVRGGGGAWPAPELSAAVFLVVAVMSRVNADLHRVLLPGAGYRILVQDAVAWLACALLALAGGLVIRRLGGPLGLRIAFSVVALLVPLARLVWHPTEPRQPLRVAAQPLGQPARPLLVVGVEGLDSRVLMMHVGGIVAGNLDELQRTGAWAPFEPHRPYLRRSLWTSVATGTLPGRHGVKSTWGWRLPWFVDEPLRLLPWTPQGSRMLLPWGLAERVVPPPATVPPLWERLRASGVATAAFEWPGVWGPTVQLERRSDLPAAGLPDRAFEVSLERALAAFPGDRDQLWQAVVRDQAVVDGAVAALGGGASNVWLHLEALSVARLLLEPTKARHTGEREVLDLVIELLDHQLGVLIEAADRDTLVVLASPYGFAPPNSWERLRRILGFGGDWRSSADDCPDGVVLLRGTGVLQGARFVEARMADLAPTLCYLLGLPVAQYMEGRVLVEAVDERFLESHQLSVVD